jgi:imidazoleglycerol phosphate synthase glutamine amidotransferase subunit HisH
MLFNNSEEGEEDGLSLLDGKVIKFDSSLKLPIPHMGWNKVQIKKKIIFFQIKSLKDFILLILIIVLAKIKKI